MIADMLSNKKLNPIATALLISGRKLGESLAFITQSYFAIPKTSAFNLSSDIDFRDFITINVLKNHIIFQLQMLSLHQRIFYILERIFQKQYKKMTIDDKIRDENCHTILTEKQQNYKHYHLGKQM